MKCRPVSVSICLGVSTCQLVDLSVCRSIGPPTYLPPDKSAGQSVCITSIIVSICRFVDLSVCRATGAVLTVTIKNNVKK